MSTLIIGDHRIASVEVLTGLVVEVAELGVAVGALATLDGLGVAAESPGW